MSGGGGEVTVGYKYYLGMHLILCHGPIDSIKSISVDSKTAWSGTAIGGPITINAADLFGGEEREGGISGTVDILMGDASQAKNSYLQNLLGVNIPAFRGVVSVILNQVYVGLNPYLKAWAFRASRIHKTSNGATQWLDTKAQIGNDMNPIHIVRECLTDNLWGLGYSASDIDDTSFTAAANTIYTEGLGVSLLWDRSMSINNFIVLVLSHIQASLYVSRSTGKFVIKLSRADYDVNSLITLDESSVSKISNFKRSSMSELINSVSVSYWDATTGKDSTVTIQDISLIAQQGCVVSTTKQFPGFTTSENATKAASTNLQALSSPLVSATIYANRKASALNVGDVFKLDWPNYGFTSLVLRVTSIELGSLDNNTVKIDAVEDVFASGSIVYSTPITSSWTSPISAPTESQFKYMREATFFELAQSMGDAGAQAVDQSSGYVVAYAVRPTSDAIAARIYTNKTGSYTESSKLDFCPTAVVSIAAGQTDTVLSVSSWIDRDQVEVGSFALIGSEIVVVTAVSLGSITVGRGCIDTVPSVIAANTRIFFIDGYSFSDGFEYSLNTHAYFKLLTITGLGTLPLTSATSLSHYVSARQFKPYPPGNFKINGSAYPSTVSGFLTISWSHRDRLMQTVKPIIDTTSGNIGPEAGVTYTLQLYGNGTLRKTVTGLTATSYTWSTEVRDSGLSSISNVGNSTVTYVVATSQTATIPSDVAANDLLLAWVMHRDVLTPPAGWTLEKSQVCNNPWFTQYLSLYKRTAVAGDANTVTTWTQATSQRLAVQIQAFRHANPASVLTAATTSSSSNVSASPGTVDYSPVTPTIAGQITVHGATNIVANTGTATTVTASYGVLTTPSSVLENRLFVAYETAMDTTQKTGSFTTDVGSLNNGEAAISAVITATDITLALNKSVRVVLKSVRSGVDSYQSHDITVSRS